MLRRPLLLILAAMLPAAMLTASANAAEILVDTISDGFAIDGRCTLREAIEAANTDSAINECDAGSGADIIMLGATSTHRVSVAGANEDLNQTGDFDIREDLTIRPADPAIVVSIAQEHADRVFEIFDGADFTLERIEIGGGDVIGFGGGIFGQEETSRIRLISSVIFANDATLFGGGVFAAGPLEIRDSTVLENVSAFGGGIYMSDSSPLTLVRSTVFDNFASSDGAGVSAEVMYIEDSTFAQNQAFRHGGALAWRPGGSVADTSWIVNSTITENKCREHGGGIYHAGFGTLELHNVTVAYNEVDTDGNDNGDGGGIFIANGTVRPRNSIIAANVDLSAGGAPTLAPDCSGVMDSGGHNLISVVDFTECTVTGLTATDIDGTSNNPVDAELDCLAQHEGPTMTVMPADTSPAVDAGDPAGCLSPGGVNLRADQRGHQRPWDGPDGDVIARCDIGAVEVGAPAVEILFNDGFESGDTTAWNSSRAFQRALVGEAMATKANRGGACIPQ